MSTFSEVRPGDELWVINGHQNSAFEANVIRVTDDEIEVEVPEKQGAVYTFSREDGTAVHGPSVTKSFLAFDGDWKIRVILDRKENNWFHESLVNQAAEFKWEPTAERAQGLHDLLDKWTTFVANADPIALVSASVTEYEEAKASQVTVE